MKFSLVGSPPYDRESLVEIDLIADHALIVVFRPLSLHCHAAWS